MRPLIKVWINTAIQTFPIEKSTGHISTTSVYIEANFPGTLIVQAADPGGKFLYSYAWTPAGPEIVVYAIDATTGSLSQAAGSPYPVSQQGDNAHLFLSPSGKFLYVYGKVTDQSNLIWPALYIYSLDPTTGTPTPTSSSPIVLPHANELTGFPKFSPSGNLLYMPERFADNERQRQFTDIGVFKVNQADGSISASAVSSVSTLYSTFYPDPSGKVLLIGPGGSNYQTFWSYLVDDSTGALTPAQGSPFFANDPNTLNQFYTIIRIP